MASPIDTLYMNLLQEIRDARCMIGRLKSTTSHPDSNCDRHADIDRLLLTFQSMRNRLTSLKRRIQLSPTTNAAAGGATDDGAK